MRKKKNIILAKIVPPLGEHGIPYDHKFLSLALFYLKAFAETDPDIRRGVQIHIRLFAMNSNDEDILREIWAEKPDAVFFGAYLTEFEKTRNVCRKIHYVMPDTPVILGGPCVLKPEPFFEKNPAVDIVVIGEGELPFRDLAKALARNEPLTGIPGTAWRDAHGRVVREPAPKKQVELADIPIVITPEFVADCAGIAIMETSRGCPNQCKFCGMGLVRGMRHYPEERVEQELAAVLSNPRIKRLFIGDSDFFTNKGRSLRFVDMIRRHNRFKTQIELYADFLSVDEELLTRARASWIHDTLRIPIQTTSRKALNTSGRHWFSLTQLRDNIPTVLRLFPSTWAEIIVGLPDDNYRGIRASFEWCLNNGLKFVRSHRLCCLPNSEYAENPEQYGIIHDEKPPHYVYASRGFPFSDIHKAETLSLNYQIMVSFIDTFDYHNLKAAGIDMMRVAETLHTAPGWDQSFVPDQEANITEALPGGADMLLSHIREKYGVADSAAAFLADLFRFRFACLTLYNNYRQNVLFNPLISNEPAPGAIPAVPFYNVFKARFDIPAYLDGRTGLDKPRRRDTCLLLLYSYTLNRVAPWPADNPDTALSIFSDLRKLLSPAGDLSPADNSRAAVAARLSQGGFVFYTADPGPGKRGGKQP